MQRRYYIYMCLGVCSFFHYSRAQRIVTAFCRNRIIVKLLRKTKRKTNLPYACTHSAPSFHLFLHTIFDDDFCRNLWLTKGQTSWMYNKDWVKVLSPMKVWLQKSCFVLDHSFFFGIAITASRNWLKSNW